MNEVSMVFGRERHMLGTVTLPDRPGPDSIGFIVLNAGVIHRVGPHRWHVKLSRRMADLGYPTLRFDPSGLGDSRVPHDALPFQEQAVRDVREAMDHLGDLTGVNRFVVGGICSGAENGFNTALADPRVVGVWMLDGYAFPTSRTRRRRYTLKLQSMSLPEIVDAGRRKLAGLMRRDNGAVVPGAEPAPATRGPEPAEFARSLQSMIDRGVSVYMIYSGSVIQNYNYDAQLRDVFAGERFLDAVRCDYRPDIDHTVTTLECQRKLLDLLSQWCGGIHAARASGT